MKHDNVFLRVETVINEPDEFRVRGGGRRVTAWVPLWKSVATLSRYCESSLRSNALYLNALARVDDPTEVVCALDSITTRKHTATARPVKPSHPLSRPEAQLFATLMRGEHALHGFTNRELVRSSTPPPFAWTTIPGSAAPRSVGSPTGSTSID